MKTIVKVLFAVLFVVLMSTPALTQSIRLEAEDGILMSGNSDIYNLRPAYEFGANGNWFGPIGILLGAPANFSVLHTEDTEVLLGYNIDVTAGTYSVNVRYNTPPYPAGLILVFDRDTANEQTVVETLPAVEIGVLLTGSFEEITLATTVTLTNGAHAVDVAMYNRTDGGKNWILDYVEFERDLNVDIANLNVDIANLQAQIDAILGNYGQAKKAYREQ